MATCNVQDLLTDNEFMCYGAYELEVMLTQLLCNLLDKLQNGGEVTCDPATLLEQGACFQGKSVFVLKALQNQLLCDISNAV
jgi:hypothetical protein